MSVRVCVYRWYEDARLLMESVGFRACYERRYHLDVNVENLDDAYFGFYARECDEPTSLEKVVFTLYSFTYSNYDFRLIHVY